MAVRIRLEVIRNFLGQLSSLARRPGALRLGLATALDKIFTEAEFRWLYQEQNLYGAFEPGDHAKLDQMTLQFQEARDVIYAVIAYDRGSDTALNAAFAADAIERLHVALEKMAKINQDYLNLAAVRVPKIIRTLSGVDEEADQATPAASVRSEITRRSASPSQGDIRPKSRRVRASDPITNGAGDPTARRTGHDGRCREPRA